jgi:hypothetical protein
MNLCRECGLPIKACNALAMYRRSHGLFKREKIGEADEAANSANDWYQQFKAEQDDLLRSPK